MTEKARILPVDSKSAVRRFTDYPFSLYRSDPNWVPPLKSSNFKLFSGRGAFFEHAETRLFLAERGGKTAGRIMAVHNRAHNARHSDKMGFFGFFECENDPETARSLLDAACAWLKGRGLENLRGPVNPSMNQECGALIEGFGMPPVALMPYNPDYYPALFEAAGLSKCKDLFAYILKRENFEPGTPIYDRIVKTAEFMKKRHPEVTVRPIDIRKYKEDILRFTEVFEEARRNNWGYVPVTKAEMEEMATDLRPVADPEIVIFAEVNGEPAGASLALPDINEILKKIGGSLFPFGFITFLRMRRRLKGMRIFGIAALERYRHFGITALLFVETLLRGLPRGYQYCEASWVLEDNVMSNRTIENVAKPEKYKTYRIYEKSL